MVSRAAWLLGALAAVAGCGSFQDPNIVLDLRVLAIDSSPPDQVVDIDLTAPPDPQAVISQLVPVTMCALVADPGLDRQLAWSVAMCPFGDAASGERCDEDPDNTYAIASGVVDDPDTTVPAPPLCWTINPDASLLSLLLDIAEGDDLHGVGGIDVDVLLRIGGIDADRSLDQYASRTLRVLPRIPAALMPNHNPTIDHVDTTPTDVAGAPVEPLALGRCAENPAPLEVPPGTKLRLTPVEPPGAREVYVAPTLDGKSQTFTESLTYQWIASAGGLSRGKTGGPHDLSGNPAPLFTDFKAPASKDLDGPTNISLWIIQRDERLGLTWYESCLHVTPAATPPSP
jgi:hypothetical protein